MLEFTCDICGSTHIASFDLGKITYQHQNKRYQITTDAEPCATCQKELLKATEEAKERIKAKKHETASN